MSKPNFIKVKGFLQILFSFLWEAQILYSNVVCQNILEQNNGILQSFGKLELKKISLFE